MRCGIVATDFSKASENAFQYALAFADRNGPLKLVVSHVFREASHGLLTEKQLAQYKGQEKHKSMEQVKRFSSVAPDLTSEDAVMRHQIEVISEQGSPSQVIIELADKKMAECIVIGAKRSPGLLKRLFGQVSQKLIYGARVPVLVIPETWTKRRWELVALLAFDASELESLNTLSNSDVLRGFNSKQSIVISKGHHSGMSRSGDQPILEYKDVPDLAHTLKSLDVDLVCMQASADMEHHRMEVIHKVYDKLGLPMMFVKP